MATKLGINTTQYFIVYVYFDAFICHFQTWIRYSQVEKRKPKLKIFLLVHLQGDNKQKS